MIDRRKRSERREYHRLSLNTTVRFLRSGAAPHEVLTARVLDVSPTGVRIELDEPLILGECVLIEIRESDRHSVNLSAQVVWVASAEDNQHSVGCELRVELARKQFLMLQELVSTPV